MSSEISERLKRAVIEMDSEIATLTSLEIISARMDVADAIINGLNEGMRAVAESYDRREIFLPQVLASANAFYVAFDILRPHLAVNIERPGRKLTIGVVEGDIHDIGKNLIKVMIEAHGYKCVDLGKDVPTEKFLENVIETKPDFVAISTLMTPTLIGMRDVVLLMVEKDVRNDRKVMVGGGQVSQEFSDRIGADFYGANERDTIAWLKEQEREEADK